MIPARAWRSDSVPPSTREPGPEASSSHHPLPAIVRQNSSESGQIVSTPAINEPRSPSPSLLNPRQTVRKVKSFNALGIHSSNRASKSTPDLRASDTSQENIPPNKTSSSGGSSSDRPRKNSSFGLGLSWSGLVSSNEPQSDDRPSLKTRRSFSFLRPQPRSVTAPPRTYAAPTPSLLTPTLPDPTPSPPITASPEACTPPALPALPPPSLPPLEFQSSANWDLSSSSSKSSRPSSPSALPVRPSTLARNRSTSLGRWTKSLRGAISPSPPPSPQPPPPPPLPQSGRARSGSTNSLKTSNERRASMRRSLSHQSSTSSRPNPYFSNELLPNQHPHLSMPSSPLAQPTDAAYPTYVYPEHANRGSTLTFALPEPRNSTSSPRSSFADVRNAASSPNPEHPRPRPARRNSMATAIHALNPFNHHSNSSRQSLLSSRSASEERERVIRGSTSMPNSPQDEPDLATLLGRRGSSQTEFGQIQGDSRRRSGSATSGAGSSGFFSSVFGRRRGNTIALHNLSPPTDLPPASPLPPAPTPPGEHERRPSTSSTASFHSAHSDPNILSSHANYQKFPAPSSNFASALPSSNPSPASSRKPSMIFSSSKQTGTRSSLSSQASPTLPPTLPCKEAKPPKAGENDTPETYLLRLEETCAKSQIAKLLASSSDPFYVEALRIYIARFQFQELPIDIALRKLLMELFLPKETQQIDRVMETFAQRYHEENPDIFATSDQCYILAFSLIMLHTDAFNSHNKNKMSKEDYTKNTRIEGLPVELLEYCYDNIVWAPFLYVDDHTALASQSSNHLTATLSSSLTSGKEKARTEVYQLIQQGTTQKLRLGVHRNVPFKNPYSFTGTVPFFNSSDLHDAFVRSHKIVLSQENAHLRESPAATEDTTSSGIAGLQLNAVPSFAPVLEYAKAGLLLRKDDLANGGKKASSRKWKEWAVVLTASQLLFFKDPQMLDVFLSPAGMDSDGRCTATLPPSRHFKPDTVLSLKGFVAIYDFSFTKRPNTFILVAPDSGTQLLCQAADDADMNEWIALINWAASFQNTGVKIRTESTIDPSRRLPHASTESDLSLEDTQSLVYSAQEQVVDTTPSSDHEWDDDHVFEQFTHGDLTHLSGGRASRTAIVRRCIYELDQVISNDKADLQRDLRRAKVLHSLQPFSTSSRTRLATHVPPLARRIRQTRLRICKNSVAREVLARDLLSEERDITRVLMQGAKPSRPSLQSHKSDFNVNRAGLTQSDGGTAMTRSRTEEF